MLTVIFPGEPGLTGFIEANDGGSGGDNSAIRRAELQSNRITTNKPTPNVLQDALPVAQPTVSEH